jgi:hypothetical protein
MFTGLHSVEQETASVLVLEFVRKGIALRPAQFFVRERKCHVNVISR